MSDRQSTGLFEVAFYCVLLFALLIWAFKHLSIPWLP